MASLSYHPFGVKLLLSDAEVKYAIAAISASNGATTVTATLLAIFGIAAGGPVIAAIVAGVLTIGIAGMTACNAPGRGIVITVLWVGVPWCKSR